MVMPDDDTRCRVTVDDGGDEAADDDAAAFDGDRTGRIGLALRGNRGGGVDQDGRLDHGGRLHADPAAALMTDAAVENRAALPRGKKRGAGTGGQKSGQLDASAGSEKDAAGVVAFAAGVDDGCPLRTWRDRRW